LLQWSTVVTGEILSQSGDDPRGIREREKRGKGENKNIKNEYFTELEQKLVVSYSFHLINVEFLVVS